MADLLQKTVQFQDLWGIVPRKIAKQTAMKAWNKLNAADRQAAVESAGGWFRWWRKENPQASWIHPSTYLNQRRWEDDWQDPLPKQTEDMVKFYADWINSDRPLPPMGISFSMQTAVFDAGLVTAQRMRERL